MDPARLAAVPAFASLADADLQALAAVASEHEAGAGDAVVTQGEFGHALYAIESGEAAVLADGEAVATLGPGDLFGEIAVLSSGRRTTSVVAVTPLRLLVLFKRDVWRLETAAPSTAERLRALVAERKAQLYA